MGRIPHTLIVCYNISVKIRDIGCNDFVAAARNRRMVRLKLNIDAYLWIEAVVKSWPRSKPLPEQFYGELPLVGKSESRTLREYGIYEVDNYNGE